MKKLNHPLTALITLALFVGLAWYSQHPPRRPNCQDLGLCDLNTGEVHEYLSAADTAKIVYLYGGSTSY